LSGLSTGTLLLAAGVTVGTALLFAVALAVKALRDFSTAGPQLPRDIIEQYRLYAGWAVASLTFWSAIVAFYLAGVGVLAYVHVAVILGLTFSVPIAVAAAVTGLGAAILLRFQYLLLHCPALIVASSHYRTSRFYHLWRKLSPQRLRLLNIGLMLAAGALVLIAQGVLVSQQQWALSLWLAAITAVWVAIFRAASAAPEPPPRAAGTTDPSTPNILMIGSDTLREDRLGIAGYHRKLTPTLDALAARGAWFENCYVPCGRTAPSLLSMLTGTWPHTHGVRDNFVEDKETRLQVPALAQLLRERGYHTAAVSDWCGADLGKFNLGFQELDLPDDSWNLRYLLRQGPKDLRLFLSLFLRNRLGKRVVPEIYYIGGVPLTEKLGKDVRRTLSRLAEDGQPFLLNAFFSTTHPPFGSEYPYYTLFSDRAYSGESKFVMARLTDPFEIIRRQGEPRTEFDLDQILALYDGCVARFDDEVGSILRHLRDCGLADNTIVVVYSDHGMEFFEHETWGQGNSVLGDHSARIPLIIADPRQAGGRHVREIVRTIDLAPTLLELAGAAVPPAMEGASLAGCIHGAACPELPAFNESGIWLTELPGIPAAHLRYPNLLEMLDIPDHRTGTLAIKRAYRDRIIEARDRMVRSGRWKLTYHPLEEGALFQLFDLEADPGCRRNVSAEHPDVVAQLQHLLVDWMRGDRERRWVDEHMVRAGLRTGE
jgi:arylsulfatase A-like enzyme